MAVVAEAPQPAAPDPAAPQAPAPAPAPSPEPGTAPVVEPKPAVEPQPEAPAAPGGDASVAEAQTQLAQLLEAAKVTTFDDLVKLVGKRIPDLMSERDLANNERDSMRTEAISKDKDWISTIRSWAALGMDAKKITEWLDTHEKRQKEQTRESKAGVSDTLTAINELYRAGETKFAAYLEDLRAASPNIVITKNTLPGLRSTFDKFSGGAPATTETPAPVAAPVTPAAPASVVATPPKVVSAGGSQAAPVYKRGDQALDLFHKAGSVGVPHEPART